MADKIKIGAELDTAEVERQLSELQKRVNSFRMGGMQMGPAGLGGASSIGNQANVDRMRQSQLDVFKRLQNQISSDLNSQVKSHSNIVKQLDEQTKKLKEINKKTEEYKNLKKEIADLQKQEEDSLNTVARLQSQKSQMQGMDPRSFAEKGGFGRLGRAFGTGGFGGLNRAATRMGLGGLAGLAGSAIGGLGTGLGAIGGGMQALGNFNYMLADLPARQAGRELGIAQGTTQMRGRAIRGENLEDIIFAPERAKSIKSTMDFFEDADSARQMRATGKAAGGLAGAIGAGALAGTAFGGPLGTVVGAGVGLATGLGIFGSSEEAYYGLTGNRGALSQMTGKEAMERYETFKMRDRMADPTKYYQKKFYSENRDRLLALQRSGGLTEDEMYGGSGFIQSGAGEFLFQDRANMAQQITAAGGSGSAATRGGLNVLALQAQRSMGLTNAGQSLGRLSGYMNAEESEDAFIRILSKGVSIGLDDSEFREEQKDYLAQVSAIASQIGGGEDMVSAALTAGIEGDITRRGVQMSADAFQALEGAMNQQGGITAAARAGLISGNDMFSNIKGMDRLNFQRMQMKDIREDSSAMQMYFKQATGKEVKGNEEEFAKFVNERQDIQRKALFQAYKGTTMGKTLSSLYEKGKNEKLSEEEITEAEQMLGNIPEFASMSEEKRRVLARQYLGTERIEEEDKRKRKAALRKKAMIENERRKRGQGIPFSTAESGFMDFATAGIPGMDTGKNPMAIPMPTMTDEEMKRTGDFLKTDKGTKSDELLAAQAKQQAKQFENMSKNMNEMFSSIMENLDQTLEQQVEMESFNEALKGGADAVEKFLNALKGVKSKPKLAPNEIVVNGKKKRINIRTGVVLKDG